ncbi:hypothetical protein [Paenibacillus sp.]|uniref:hypothetical protein n=1 Tax=Paenibacillus sp. TaxID=58172 RepID=UPI002D59480D|nr:hypothetical protein [Paenibacillus sp.]HZG83655.1 hypothetical protein [Paenibacillus sp.]
MAMKPANERADDMTAETKSAPATSAKESNENDLQLKQEQPAFKESGKIASEKLRYEHADDIYPT